MTNKSLKGNRIALDRFVPDSEFPVRSIRCVPRGIVGHWLAGNVPLLGMLGLVQAILTKNANIVRVPASNSAVIPIILDVISKTKIKLASGVTVNGADITDTISLIYYDKTDLDFANNFSKLCDARIAWGGAEAVHAVSNLATQIDCQTVIFDRNYHILLSVQKCWPKDRILNSYFADWLQIVLFSINMLVIHNIELLLRIQNT